MFLQMTRVLVITLSHTKIKGKEIITMNRNSTNYSNFYNEIVTSIRGAGIGELEYTEKGKEKDIKDYNADNAICLILGEDIEIK